MTDRRPPKNVRLEDQDPEGQAAASPEPELGGTAPQAPVTPAALEGSSSFRRDGGPGSVMRERQPGYGGMDARAATEGQENWQNVTSDRYGHPVEAVIPELGEEPSSDAQETESGRPGSKGQPSEDQ